MASRPTGDEPRQGTGPSDGATGAQPNAAEAPESGLVPAPEDDQNPLQLLRRYGPGAFRTSRKHHQGAIPEELLGVLAASGDIDESTKDRIRPIIEDHLLTVASQLATRHSLYLGCLSWLRDSPTLAGYLPWVVLIPLLLLSTPQGFWGGVLAGVLSVIALLLEMFIALRSIIFFKWLFGHLGIRGGRRLPAFLVTTLIFVVLAEYATVIGGPDWVVSSIRSASWAVAAYFGCFTLVAQGLLLAVMLLRQRAIPKFPDAEVVATLLSVLAVFHGTRQRWGKDRDLVSLAAAMLDDIANMIERALPHRVREGGRDTARRLKREARAIAAAVRDWKQNVLMRGEVGFQVVQASLAKMLVHVAEGNWAALEHTEPRPGMVVRTHWAFWMSRVLIVAGLPYVALRLVEAGGVSLTQATAERLEELALWWATATILLALEPRASQIAGLAKDIGPPGR